MKRRRVCVALLGWLALPLAGCVSSPTQFVKTDIDRVADLHRREARASLTRLAEKLYKRNPREWKKSGHASLEQALARLAEPAAVPPPPPERQRGTAAVLAALREDYAQDRVAAYIGGLMEMLDDAFEGKTEFFLLDELDAQKLHNAARNAEIAAWKLANARRTTPVDDLPAGAPLLYANEIAPLANLSFEREFGRLIGNLDILAQIVADKTQRTVVKLFQNLATAVFLPIK